MNCKIIGYEFKTLEVTLASGESFYAERGSVVYTDEALQLFDALEYKNDFLRELLLYLVGRKN